MTGKKPVYEEDVVNNIIEIHMRGMRPHSNERPYTNLY